MPRYLCYATENKYQGLHGISDVFIEEAKDIQEACETCYNACIDLMFSYWDIEEELREEALFHLEEEEWKDEDRFNEMFEEVIMENACVAVWKIDEVKAKNISTEVLNTIAANDMDEVIEKYCIKE